MMLNWQRGERWCTYVQRRRARRVHLVELALANAQNEHSQRLAVRFAQTLRVNVPQPPASRTEVGLKSPGL